MEELNGMVMTKIQRKYYNALREIITKKTTKAIARPQLKFRAIVFDFTTSKMFDTSIIIFIFLNMVVMAMDHYGATDSFCTVLQFLNTLFIAIFTVECVLKIIALQVFYFKDPWNVFDFIVVTLSVSGIVLRDFLQKSVISPILFRVVRFVKVVHIFRMVKGVRQIRTLLLALTMSLPRLFQISLLYFLVMSIYAVFGMSFFMHVRQRSGITDILNFQTFSQSLLLLFQLSTSAGWNDVLQGIMEEYDCTRDVDFIGDCGNYNIAVVYLISYLFVSFIIVNMYSAAILEKFYQAIEDFEDGLISDDYDMFYEIWKRCDPDGSKFIKYSQLGTFLDMLVEPLRIPRPNKYKMIMMDIPIYKGDVVCCIDVLQALIKNFFVKMGNETECLEEVETPLDKHREDVRGICIGSTISRQREEYAACVLQLAWRQWNCKMV